jgi:hypothetical protein
MQNTPIWKTIPLFLGSSQKGTFSSAVVMGDGCVIVSVSAFQTGMVWLPWFQAGMVCFFGFPAGMV